MKNGYGTSLRRLLVLLALAVNPAQGESASDGCPANLDFELRQLAGDQQVSLCEQYAGKVLLIVNTASRCGFTPQFEGLEALYQAYKDDGLVVLGFPSNDFNQELSSEAEIKGFCRVSYGVEFPMFEKIRVKGDSAHPLYKRLAAETNTQPGWNFHKYLVDRNGEVVASFATMTRPQDPRLVAAIEKLL